MLNYALDNGYLSGYESGKEVLNAAGLQKRLINLEHADCMIRYRNGRFEVKPGMVNKPVVQVSWYGSAFYCNMLSEYEGLTKLYFLEDWSCYHYGAEGYRLPTEAEWEYAAKYNDNRFYPWGETEPDQTKANYGNPSSGAIAEIGSYSPVGDNALAIADLAGNVMEWCNDSYDKYKAVVQNNPTGPLENRTTRVVRGGSWYHSADKLSTSARSFGAPDFTLSYFGFRPVRIVP